MSWIDLVVAAGAAAMVMLVPGMLLALLLGLRGLWAWGAAGPFGLSVIVLASLAAPLLGVGWGLLPVAATFGVIAAGIAVVRLALRGRIPSAAKGAAAGSAWPVLAALSLAAVLIWAQLVAVVQAPGNISQSFDNIFHLNAIRFVVDTANASPLHVGSMTSDSGGVWFYPSAWHAVASLVVQLVGSDVTIASNALMFALAGLLWPAGCVLLARSLFGTSPALTLAAGAFAAAVPAMPLLPLDYGVLYPFALGIAVTPAALALTLALVRVAGFRPGVPVWAGVVAVLGALPGVTIAHPGAFMAWLVFAFAAAVVAYGGVLRTRPAARTIAWASAGFGGFLVLALLAWRVLKPPLEARTWQPTLTLGQGIGEALTLSYWAGGVPVVVVVATVVGLVAVFRRPSPAGVWAVLSFGGASLLYVAAIAFPWPNLRDLLTASWYNNAPRLAVIVVVAIVPLAALGARETWRGLRALARRRGIRLGPVARPAVAVVALAGLVSLSQLGAMGQAVRHAQWGYALSEDSPLVSTDEMALLRRLANTVPEDAVIAGSPWTGAGLAYALSGREVLMPHTLMDVDEETSLINEHLEDAARMPEVCEAVDEKDVEYVLDFGSREVHGAAHPFPGIDELSTSDAVELVDAEGEAALYRVIACEESR